MFVKLVFSPVGAAQRETLHFGLAFRATLAIFIVRMSIHLYENITTSQPNIVEFVYVIVYNVSIM